MAMAMAMAASLSQRPTDREIRVLDLLPGVPDEIIECHVRKVSVDGDAEYEALSYVWGDAVEERSVQVSGDLINISPNLHDALRCLRYPNQTRTLWVDQICINQWDLEEKASQVALMRTIYQKCRRCIVWLGELFSTYYDETFASIITSPISISAAEAVLEFVTAVAAVKTNPIQELPILFQDTSQGEAARSAFAAFSAYGNPWWSRIWTVQEAIIPPSATIVWGHLSIDRDLLYRAAQLLHMSTEGRHFPDSKTFWPLRVRYSDMITSLVYPVRSFGRFEKGEKPLNVLMRWRHRQAKDPRDKVYALLGLVPPGSIPSAESCDYGTTSQSLFSRVTFDLMASEQGLRPLLGSSNVPHQTPGLPSWAIDFSSRDVLGKRQLRWWGHSDRYKQFSADSDQKLEATLENEEILSLKGKWVDTVEQISQCGLNVHESESIMLLDLHESVLDCIKTVQQFCITKKGTDVYRTGESYNRAVWKTLVGDLLINESPIERTDKCSDSEFERLMHQLKVASLEFDPPHCIENPLYESLRGMLPNHTFFITATGYVGMGPRQTLPGDQVWIFNGGRVPFVMRECRTDDNTVSGLDLTLVGDAYVHGIMDGQAVSGEHVTQTAHIY